MSEPLEFPVDRDLETELRRILLEANTPEALGVPAELEPVPAELEVRMARFLQDPFRAAKRTRLPRWRRVLTNVACVLLALSLTLGGILFVSPTARAWAGRVIDMLITWTEEGSTSFIFTGPQTEDTTERSWRPAYLPEGYEETKIRQMARHYRIEFENEEGQMIAFIYQPVKEGYMFDMDNEHSDYSEIIMNGRTAYLFDSNTEGRPSCLIWFSEKGGVGFQLLGELTGAELIEIAESVYVLPNPETNE